MSEQTPIGSDNSGSLIDNYLNGGAVDPNAAGAAGQSTGKNEPAKNEGETVPKGEYDQLMDKIGIQGEELGKYRALFEDTAPILEKLNDNPALAKAILDDKITSQLVEDVLSGKLTKKDAETVTQAHTEVKKEVGDKKYEAMAPEKIEELVAKKAAELIGEAEKKFSKNLTDMEKLQDYQQSITDFIANTPDFPEYAAAIEKLVDTTGITNIKVTYDAVKGHALQEKSKAEEERRAAEEKKKIAANAGGGSSQTTAKFADGDVFDKMVGGHKNPNVL